MERIVIHLPDDTLPSFDYLDLLSEVKSEDVSEAIQDWKEKHQGMDLQNILEAEIDE